VTVHIDILIYVHHIQIYIHLQEIHNPSLISPVFFGKKKNSQKPRREVRFDETLVVWQRSEFTFLYNLLGIYKYIHIYIYIYPYIYTYT
jgi:hypothetical protein